MKKRGLFIIAALCFAIEGQQKEAISTSIMTFEDAYDLETRLKRPHELSAVQILNSKRDGWLGEDKCRMDWFLRTTEYFGRLYSLDLAYQNVDDSFIEGFAQKGFERITSIDLTGNPRITVKSLQYILDSDSLGSLRELPQISARYGRISSEIAVKVRETSIPHQKLIYFNENPRFDFLIHYRRASDDVQLRPSAEGSIKWLQVSDY